MRARDNYRCTQCGITNDEHLALHGQALEVHRVRPGTAYTVSGCVTLCKACHSPRPRSARGVRRRPTRARVSGRPRHDPAGVKRPLTVWLTPAEWEHCASLGRSVAQEGVRRLVHASIGAAAGAGGKLSE